MELRERNM